MAVTGALTLFGGPLVFVVHDVAGFALGGRAGVEVPRARRGGAFAHRLGPLAAVLGRRDAADRRAWSSAIQPTAFGYNPLNLHSVLGAVLDRRGAGACARAGEAAARRDLTRRQFLMSAGVGAAALLAWQVQRTPGLASARRRFTGSYDSGEDVPGDVVGGRRTRAR